MTKLPIELLAKLLELFYNDKDGCDKKLCPKRIVGGIIIVAVVIYSLFFASGCQGTSTEIKGAVEFGKEGKRIRVEGGIVLEKKDLKKCIKHKKCFEKDKVHYKVEKEKEDGKQHNPSDGPVEKDGQKRKADDVGKTESGGEDLDSSK